MSARRKAETGTRADDPWTQLATRIPKTLHRGLRLVCVESEVTVRDFVVAALREKLSRTTTGTRATRKG